MELVVTVLQQTTERSGVDFDVTVLGLATTDHVLVMEEPLRPGRKAEATHMVTVAGGEATNVCLTLVALGIRTNLVTRFGGDHDGRDHQRLLESSGCTTTGSMTMADVRHHFAVVLVDVGSGERSIVTYKDPALTVTPDQLPESLLARSTAFYSDGREPMATLHALGLARRLGVRTFVDAESAEWLGDALAYVDELVVPAHVVRSLTGEDVAKDGARHLARSGPDVVVVTMGEQGAVAVEAGHESHHQPAWPTNVVDTTGAGDAFHGGYVAARLRGLPVPAAMELAARAASLTCSYVQPRAPAELLAALRMPCVDPDSRAMPNGHAEAVRS